MTENATIHRLPAASNVIDIQGGYAGIRADIETLARNLDQVFAADTSADPAHWSERTAATRAYGHCAVVALIVQERFGGTLRRAIVNGESHYWNFTPHGVVDLTRTQFDDPADIHDEVHRDRAYLTASAATTARYETLKARLADIERA